MGKFCHPEKRSVVGQCEGVCRSIAFVRDDALYGKSKTPSEETLTGFWCPGQGLIYENIYKQLKFEYIYNILKYSILKLYAMKCILSVFSCFAKCGHGADTKVLLYSNLNHIFVEHKMRMYGKSYICFGARGE